MRKWDLLSDAANRLKSQESISLQEADDQIIEAIAACELEAICRSRRYDAHEKRWTGVRRRSLDPSWLSCIAYVNVEDSHIRFDSYDAARARLHGEVTNPPEHAREIA